MDDVRLMLTERVAEVRARIEAACLRARRSANEVALIGVTKTVTAEVAKVAFELGLHDLGESKPQELWKKAAAIPEARWHLIGHLQRNKIDRTIPLVALVHSVDSLRLLEALDAFGRDRGTPVPALLEVNCSREASKGGFRPEDVLPSSDKLMSLDGVAFRGLMTMAPFFDDPEKCRPTFADLRELRAKLRTATGLPLPHLSMGMSNDFAVAIEEGATHVRIGTTLFEGIR